MARKKPQIIGSAKKFQGTDKLSANDLKRLRVTTFNGAASIFLENWKKEPVFLVGLTLSQDNENIENATALLQGFLWPEGKELSANNFWHFDKELVMTFEKIDLEKFEFDGCNTSRLLSHTLLDYSVKVKGADQALSDSELKSLGFPGFCLRVFCHAISTTSVKVELLLYPLERDTLLKENGLAVNYYFPGVTVEKFEVELGIQRDELLDNNYGCPILPVIKTKEPIRSNSKVPGREEITHAIGTLLRATRAPDGKSSYTTMLKSWGQLKKHGESKLKRPVYDDWIWPKPKEPSRQTGTHLYRNSNLIYVCVTNRHHKRGKKSSICFLKN